MADLEINAVPDIANENDDFKLLGSNLTSSTNESLNISKDNLKNIFGNAVVDRHTVAKTALIDTATYADLDAVKLAYSTGYDKALVAFSSINGLPALYEITDGEEPIAFEDVVVGTTINNNQDDKFYKWDGTSWTEIESAPTGTTVSLNEVNHIYNNKVNGGDASQQGFTVNPSYSTVLDTDINEQVHQLDILTGAGFNPETSRPLSQEDIDQMYNYGWYYIFDVKFLTTEDGRGFNFGFGLPTGGTNLWGKAANDIMVCTYRRAGADLRLGVDALQSTATVSDGYSNNEYTTVIVESEAQSGTIDVYVDGQRLFDNFNWNFTSTAWKDTTYVHIANNNATVKGNIRKFGLYIYGRDQVSEITEEEILSSPVFAYNSDHKRIDTLELKHYDNVPFGTTLTIINRSDFDIILDITDDKTLIKDDATDITIISGDTLEIIKTNQEVDNFTIWNIKTPDELITKYDKHTVTKVSLIDTTVYADLDAVKAAYTSGYQKQLIAFESINSLPALYEITDDEEPIAFETVVTGTTVNDNQDDKFYKWDGTSWIELGSDKAQESDKYDRHTITKVALIDTATYADLDAVKLAYTSGYDKAFVAFQSVDSLPALYEITDGEEPIVFEPVVTGTTVNNNQDNQFYKWSGSSWDFIDAPTSNIISFDWQEELYIAEKGLPASQGWSEIGTGSANLSLVTDTVFGISQQVLKLDDDYSDGLATIQKSLDSDDWQFIYDNGASFSGTTRMDVTDGSSFICTLQCDPPEAPDGSTAFRRFLLVFTLSGTDLQVTVGGTTTNLNVNGTEYFNFELVAPPLLADATLYINGEDSGVTLPFEVNTGGKGSIVSLTSGTSSGVDRVFYAAKYGVVIYKEPATKTINNVDLQGFKNVQVIFPSGKRDYVITAGNDLQGNDLGDLISLTASNVGGTISFNNQDTVTPKLTVNGLASVSVLIEQKNTIVLTNQLQDANDYNLTLSTFIGSTLEDLYFSRGASKLLIGSSVLDGTGSQLQVTGGISSNATILTNSVNYEEKITEFLYSIKAEYSGFTTTDRDDLKSYIDEKLGVTDSTVTLAGGKITAINGDSPIEFLGTHVLNVNATYQGILSTRQGITPLLTTDAPVIISNNGFTTTSAGTLITDFGSGLLQGLTDDTNGSLTIQSNSRVTVNFESCILVDKMYKGFVFHVDLENTTQSKTLESVSMEMDDNLCYGKNASFITDVNSGDVLQLKLTTATGSSDIVFEEFQYKITIDGLLI